MSDVEYSVPSDPCCPSFPLTKLHISSVVSTPVMHMSHDTWGITKLHMVYNPVIYMYVIMHQHMACNQ